MIAEEESGVSDSDKSQKRAREFVHQDLVSTSKRSKIGNNLQLEAIDSSSDVYVNDHTSPTMEDIRAESEQEEEGDDDNISELLDNSDTSQNSISCISSLNNNNIDRQETKFDTIELEDDGSESPKSVLLPENLQSIQGSILENGRQGFHSDHSTKNEESSGGSTKDEIRNKDEEDNETFLQRITNESRELGKLLLLKEMEWNAILRLKKLKEIKIEKLQRQKAIDGLLEKEDLDHSDYHSLAIKLSEEEAKITDITESETRNNIRIIEKETEELTKEVFSDSAKKSVNTNSETLNKNENSKAENVFLASNALKSLVSRNRATIATHSIPISSVALASSCSPHKVIGEGRQGPIVEVASLIADYRSKTQNDSTSDKKSTKQTPNPTFLRMAQNTSVSFTDLLSRLKTLYEKDKDSNPTSSLTSATLCSSNIKTVPACRVKGTTNNTTSSGGGAGSGAGGKPPVGTTLAKLLSSNNVNPGHRNIEEAPSIINNKSANTSSSTNLDKNLSLANLLASAKSRDDQQKKKVEGAVIPFCQGCHANRAQFVCAGCANQWYCSRECQVAAWDEHSEVCSG